MNGNSQEELTALFQNELQKEIAAEQTELRDELIRHILDMPANLSLEKIIVELVRSHHPLSGLMGAVLRGELRHLENLLPRVCQQSLPEQVVTLKNFFSHYSRFQDQIIGLAERGFEQRIQELDRKLVHEHDLLLQEQTKNEWLRNDQLRLFNYFCELQVVGVARLESLESGLVSVWMTPKLERVFAAGERMRTAYTDTPEVGKTMLLDIYRLEDDLLTLRIRGTAPHPQGRRHYVRVSVNDETPFTLDLGGRTLQVWVMDFSETGLGLLLETPVQLAENQPINCRGTLRAGSKAVSIDTEGTVRWSRPEQGNIRMGVKLKLDHATRKAMQDVLLAYEHSIIQRLRELGTPELLL